MLEFSLRRGNHLFRIGRLPLGWGVLRVRRIRATLLPYYMFWGRTYQVILKTALGWSSRTDQ